MQSNTTAASRQAVYNLSPSPPLPCSKLSEKKPPGKWADKALSAGNIPLSGVLCNRRMRYTAGDNKKADPVAGNKAPAIGNYCTKCPKGQTRPEGSTSVSSCLTFCPTGQSLRSKNDSSTSYPPGNSSDPMQKQTSKEACKRCRKVHALKDCACCCSE
jgi:hypothetical protein